MVFNISESSISVWHRDIIDALGLKIVYGENKKVLKVIETQEES